MLNNQIPKFYEALRARCYNFNVDLLYVLVRLATALPKVIPRHSLESVDFDERSKQITDMIEKCVKSDCLDDAVLIQRVLSYGALGLNKKTSFANTLVNKGQAFRGGLLEESIHGRLLSIFLSCHIGAFVDNLFWGFLRSSGTKYGHVSKEFHNIIVRFPVLNKLIKNVDTWSSESRSIRCYRSNFIFARYCPAVMFFGEGFAKLIILFLATLISLRTRVGKITLDRYAWIEYFLVVMVISSLIYEYGELCNSTLRWYPSREGVRRYFFGVKVWNFLDDLGLLLLIIWTILRFRYSNEYEYENSRVFLACSTIVFSVSLLRYISVNSGVGKLVNMIFAMIASMSNFLIVVAVAMFGFVVTMYCLFHSNESYFGSGSQTFLTMFSSIFTNYDNTFSDQFNKSLQFHNLGIFLEGIFLLFISVVIMNLIIAQMNCTHDNINQVAFQTVQFEEACNAYWFMLIEERNPFCMLPPPFNIVPTLFSPAHFLYTFFFIKI